MTATPLDWGCPIPLQNYPRVLLAHGGGGRLMQQLIRQMFQQAFANPFLGQDHDGTVLGLADLPQLTADGQLAMTTDSFVVSPWQFPGGNIGQLAVHGTVNDLAMCGAQPLYLSAAFVLEEGLPMERLWQVVCAMRQAADEAGVAIVTGDTKVVQRGKADGLYITTTGIGVVPAGRQSHPSAMQPGDAVLVSGDVGRHGMAVMAVREGLAFEPAIASDTAPLAPLVDALFEQNVAVRVLRDATRGGLAAVLNELAQAAQMELCVEAPLIPVEPTVRGACEILGLDPLHVACEGRFVAVVSADTAERAVQVLRQFPAGAQAAVMGQVVGRDRPLVSLKTAIGGQRILDVPSGELLPRIC